PGPAAGDDDRDGRRRDARDRPGRHAVAPGAGSRLADGGPGGGRRPARRVPRTSSVQRRSTLLTAPPSMLRPVAVVGAMPEEVERLTAALSGSRRLDSGPFRLARGTFEGRPVVVAECGIGKVN